MSTLIRNSGWILGAGAVSFWNENWCGAVLDGPRLIDNGHLVRTALPIIEGFLPLIQSQHYQAIARVRLQPTMLIVSCVLYQSQVSFILQIFGITLGCTFQRFLGLLKFGSLGSL